MIQISLQSMEDSAEYIISSFADDYEKIVHSEGIIYFQNGTAETGAAENVSLLKG